MRDNYEPCVACGAETLPAPNGNYRRCKQTDDWGYVCHNCGYRGHLDRDPLRTAAHCERCNCNHMSIQNGREMN